MSKYTTEVRFICEVNAGLTENVGYNSVNEVVDKAVEKIFDFDFPIFDENYRKIIERKILKHYYTREICDETVGLWKLRLDTRLNEIMPYYNQLYKSELLEFNPLYTVNLETKGNRNGKEDRNKNRDNTESLNRDTTSNGSTTDTVVTDANHSVNTTGENSNVNKYTDYKKQTREESNAYSDTPQGRLSGVSENTYLTNYTKVGITDGVADDGQVTDSGSSKGNESGTNYSKVNENGSDSRTGNEKESKVGNEKETENVGTSEDYLEKVVGYTGGNASKSLKEYRETFLNIDMQVIRDLEDLFFQLW